jgi:hypothetical protein
MYMYTPSNGAHTPSNNERIQECIENVRRDAIDSMGNGTTRMYDPKIKEWKAWCIKSQFDDGDSVSEGKLVLFLTSEVIPRGNKLNSSALSLEGIESYIKPVIQLFKGQISQCQHSNQHPRSGQALKAKQYLLYFKQIRTIFYTKT